MKKYYISLGYFCEVAQDLEKLGLRNQSSPFDWGISSFPKVIEAIDKKFEGFMEYDNLSQNVNNRSHYHEDIYDFYFFHDFDKYVSLSKQYIKVKQKYDRRIDRFLASIQQPTLFIRYISSEQMHNKKSLELMWIEDNISYIYDVVKRYNPENDIVFIGDELVMSDVIKIYHVSRDEGDKVSRLPIYNNKELFNFLSNIDYSGRQENINRYLRKQKQKKSLIRRGIKKFERGWKKIFIKEYFHSKTYDIPDK